MSDLGSAIRFALASDVGQQPAILEEVEMAIQNKRYQRLLIRLLEDVDKDAHINRLRAKLAGNFELHAWVTDPRNEALVIQAVEKFLGYSLPRGALNATNLVSNEHSGIRRPIDGGAGDPASG